ncbi:MAG: hypothetical protein JWN78_2095 [Bacteroidota bacterium]|nr:hypothetical protein [Bacteroidota bacterium]
MKNNLLLLIVFISILSVLSCKKSSNSNTTTPINKPRFFENNGGGISVVDTRDIKNVKRYQYNWNSVTSKYEYNSTDDTTTQPKLKLWPSNVVDPVGTGYSYHFLNRINGTNTYTIDYGSPTLITSTLLTDYPYLFSNWQAPNKIEGYANVYEVYGVAGGSSYFFFDLDAGTYTLTRNDGIVSVDETIASLVTVPNGTLTSTSVDFRKADAVAFDYDRTSVSSNLNNIYFIDYDAMKYVQISRRDDLPDAIGRNTLVTPNWVPLTNLISGWKF